MNPLFRPEQADRLEQWAASYAKRAAALRAPRHSEAVERWRVPVEIYWQAIVLPAMRAESERDPGSVSVYQSFWLDVEGALEMIWHESRGNPDAVNASSQASGLFQHLPAYFGFRARTAAKLCAGIADPWLAHPESASIFDPDANIAAAAWLHTQRGWQPWAPYNSGKWQPYTLHTYWTGSGYAS